MPSALVPLWSGVESFVWATSPTISCSWRSPQNPCPSNRGHRAWDSPLLSPATFPPQWRVALRNTSAAISSPCDLTTATAATRHAHPGGKRRSECAWLFPQSTSLLTIPPQEFVTRTTTVKQDLIQREKCGLIVLQ